MITTQNVDGFNRLSRINYSSPFEPYLNTKILKDKNKILEVISTIKGKYVNILVIDQNEEILGIYFERVLDPEQLGLIHEEYVQKYLSRLVQ